MRKVKMPKLQNSDFIEVRLDENKEFVKINNKQTLAQVFTDCRYTKADCEAMSETLLEALRKQKFL